MQTHRWGGDPAEVPLAALSGGVWDKGPTQGGIGGQSRSGPRPNSLPWIGALLMKENRSTEAKREEAWLQGDGA